jgi:hypothetical protein
MTYFAYSQPKSPEVWAAIRKGFDAQDADPTWQKGAQRTLRRDGTAILGGLGFDQPALLKEARDTGHPHLFVDSAYIGSHEDGKRVRYRVVPDAYAHHWLPPMDSVMAAAGKFRFGKLRVSIEPWRKDGRDVLVCTSSDAHTSFFGLQTWVDDTLEQLRIGTDRPIVIRHKDDPKPFEEALKTAWAVVTWSSNVAVTAALAGVPVFVGPESAALPVGNSLAAGGGRYIDTPLYPDREPWAWHLACGQFTVDELEFDAVSYVEWAIEARKGLKVAA